MKLELFLPILIIISTRIIVALVMNKKSNFVREKSQCHKITLLSIIICVILIGIVPPSEYAKDMIDVIKIIAGSLAFLSFFLGIYKSIALRFDYVNLVTFVSCCSIIMECNTILSS